MAILALNFWRFKSRQIKIAAAPAMIMDEQKIVERFAGAISLRTVSQQNPARFDAEEFDGFRSYLQQSYPNVHQQLHLQTGLEFGDERNQSLLFKWEGNDGKRDAILLMAHYDVVPVEPATLYEWTNPPFAGYFDDEYVWGRGTLDDKCGVIGLMEAIEHLIGEGFHPSRTVYISLGHDEEIGGIRGNQPISQWMRRQGIRLEYVLDEGGGIFNDFPGLDRPVALVGVAEKGSLTTQLVVNLKETGHASIPPKDTAISILAKAIGRLHDHPFPQRLNGGAGLMLDYIGPEMPLVNRIAVSNRWLFRPLIKRQLGAIPVGNAALRTTIAPTIIGGGFKDTVLPTQASVTLNVRILPGDTVDSAMDYIKQCIDDDRVRVDEPKNSVQPSRISSADSSSFTRIHHAIKEVFPDAAVAPFVVVAGTDAKHFDDNSLSKDVYRFTPWRLGNEELKRIHGIDERISRKSFLDIVRFYERLLRHEGP
jgi:carboxypeptidase PM20D1